MSNYDRLVAELSQENLARGGRSATPVEFHWTTQWLLQKVGELQEVVADQQLQINTLRAAVKDGAVCSE